MLSRRSLLLSAVSLFGPGETLHNGIALPRPWPPERRVLDYKPMDVPYLTSPPGLIPIDVGRQLLVDDFLIAESTLTRVFHQAEYHPASPVLRPDRPWESTAAGPAAMVFSDGVWFDPSDQLFKLWYMAGYWGPLAYAFSRNGIHWEKPALPIRKGTNIVLDVPRGSTTVWLDPQEPNPARRFKLFRQVGGEQPPRFALHYSPDGIRWSSIAALSGTAKDRSTLFYNPFRRVWIFSLKEDNRDQRMRLYHESANLEDGFFFTKRTAPVSVGTRSMCRARI